MSLFAVLGPLAAAPPGGSVSWPWWSAAPFVLLLGAIAILPLVAHHWWEKNGNKGLVSAVLGLPFAAWVLFALGSAGAAWLSHAMLDYLSFVALLGSLFVISGGIHLKGSLAGTPLSNTAILGIGGTLASFIGTTGASMVLIRPLLRANEHRHRRVHIVVFFLFIVSNCGGLLTPLGDPPLFLGFLKGVPFGWTLQLWKEWLLVNGILLVVFNLLDQYILDREEKERPEHVLEEVLEHQPLRLEGAHNLLFLAGVIAVIVAKGQSLGTFPNPWPFGIQEGAMFALAWGSWAATRPEIRAANRFTFGPIVEVAVLFAGIFVTMVAPLAMLNAAGPRLGLEEPWEFFWATGALSSFLDNAPTYLAFAAAAAGLLGVAIDAPFYLADFLARGEQAAALLAAISCGAVFMGANTYIGNGPNFMVKAIAEENGVKMPSFFGYMAWSCGILLPIFLVVTWIFFR